MTNEELRTLHSLKIFSSVARSRVFRWTQKEFGSRCPKLWKMALDAFDEAWDLEFKSIEALFENPDSELSETITDCISIKWDYVFHIISLCNHVDRRDPPLRSVLPFNDRLCSRAARQLNGNGSWKLRDAG